MYNLGMAEESNSNGVFSNVRRINPETLSPEARAFLREIRNNLRQKKRITTDVSKLVAKTIIKFHYDKGEKIEPLIVEMVTVSVFVISPLWKYIPQMVFFFLLGVIYGIYSITENQEELNESVTQTILAYFTNPIYEFGVKERKKTAEAIFRVGGYLSTANYFSDPERRLPALDAVLSSALEDGMSVCDASIEETKYLRSSLSSYQRFIGRLMFFKTFGWPLLDLDSRRMREKLKEKTGI